MGFDPALARAVPENAVRFLGHAEHTHEVPHLVHMVMGHGVLTAPGHRLVLEPRSSVWLAARVPHALDLSDHSIALGPVLREEISPDRPVAALGVVPSIAELMIARMAAGPTSPSQCDLFTDALERILVSLQQDAFPTPLPTHTTVRRIAFEACALPEATLGGLCSRHRISPRQAQRLFREQTGMTFTRWRRRRLLSEAARSLRGDSSLASAARSAGFGGREDLLRALSQETGVPVPEVRQDPRAHLPAR
ncbi:helix-turn-helix domain-containing protein [Brachybacterium sp. MASK1Z-5]|uniref:Helix-turn-helix domain-containing protein n=1 Tax=Brachybacterium halotolerans TaxID=2795215 RepID=A0ABS1BAD3_9MICO|nr:helix-turn-helix domain-containing protein [Brachybacterium halotolerans]MBK0331614.1 helix-turn-helix domain-containing protein [Brachybacterium halotolerans]